MAGLPTRIDGFAAQIAKLAQCALGSILLLCAATSTNAMADEWAVPQPAWEGVWAGTIGAMPVHVCLDKTPHQQKGAYYYDHVKRLLRLVPGETGGEWFEQETYDKNGARWHISPIGRSLTGTWRDGSTALPIRLTRVGAASREFAGPCGSMALHRPRLETVRLIARPGTMNGAAYSVLTFKPGPWANDEVEISTFSLNRPGSAASRINALLRAALPKADGTGAWLDCIAANVNWSGMDGTYFRTIAPTLISERWLAVNEHGEYYCGGPHPENENIPRTFDLQFGVEVNPLNWLGPNAVHRENVGEGADGYKTLTPAFVAMILKGWKAEDPAECDDAMRRQDSWRIGVARGALVFEPDFPRVILACGEDFRVPFSRLQPWLSNRGRIMVATLPH